MSNAEGRQLGLNLIPAFWREPHQTQLPGTVLFTTPAWGRTDMVRPCWCNGVPVLCEFPPHLSVDGPSIAKVQSALFGRYLLSTRCSSRPGRSLVRSLPLRWTLLLPLERRSRWSKSKEYHNTVPQILKRVVAFTHTDTRYPSIHEEGRVELSPLEDLYYE
jgi:hypothetical protein